MDKKIKNRRTVPSFICILSAMLLTGCGAKEGSKEQINIYVTPFYDSTPLQISVGEYSSRLMSDSPRKMLKLADELKEKIDKVDATTLYVLSIRLYNLGEKDESVYWFYIAQFRAKVLMRMVPSLDPTGWPATFGAFRSLAGTWINGYAFGDPDKMFSTLEQVINDVKNMAYIGNVYAGSGLEPESRQQEIVEEEIEGVRSLIKYLTDNKEDILHQRKENGIEGKY